MGHPAPLRIHIHTMTAGSILQSVNHMLIQPHMSITQSKTCFIPVIFDHLVKLLIMG
jgi:hypothetical protein